MKLFGFETEKVLEGDSKAVRWMKLAHKASSFSCLETSRGGE